MDKAMIVAGVGFSTRAGAADIVQAVAAALERHGRPCSELGLLATIGQKRECDTFIAAAGQLGVPYRFVEAEALRSVSAATLTRSARSLEMTGLGSACEAAALGAGGDGAELLGARIIAGPVTCALARSGGIAVTGGAQRQ